MVRLSRRMEAVASLVAIRGVLADIGTDHAYVPIALAHKGKIVRAIAVDIGEGPLARARENIAGNGLEDVIETRLSDGLSALAPKEADSILIAGMGGELMLRILSEGEAVCAGAGELILQPQSDIRRVREYLRRSGWRIAAEDMVCEDGKYYPMMRAVRADGADVDALGFDVPEGRCAEEEQADVVGQCAADTYGPLLMHSGSPVLGAFLEKEHAQLEHILGQLDAQPESEKIIARREQVRQKLACNEYTYAMLGADQMMDVKVEIEVEPGRTELVSVAEGTGLLELAGKYQENFPDAIILALVDNKLRELNKKITKPCRVSFLTVTSRDGKRAYRRSVTLLMQKAVHDLWDGQVKVRVFYSLGEGYYCELEGCANSIERIAQTQERMHELAAQDIPIEKHSVKSLEAEEKFASYGMKDKERLLRYRRSSRVNLYRISGMEDYFYGYMAPATGMLKAFALIPYEEGFVLCFPNRKGDTVEPLSASRKLYQTLKESRRWSRMLGIGTIGALNDAIASGRGGEIMLLQEALMEERIGTLAAKIAERVRGGAGTKFIMIAGPSSSGKTTFSHRLSIQLMAKGLKPHPIGLDNYYADREKCPRDEFGNLDFECLEALDVELFNEDMTKLLNGEQVELPSFNFKTGKREYRGRTLALGADDILVIEGIHGLNDRLSYSLPNESKFKIYISALTQLNIDEHNPLPTTDGRLLRRIVRDARTRGTTARETIAMWDSVRRGEERYIFPFQDSADVMFNSALVYEIAVLKVYAEPLLFQIPRDCEEYLEAKRLLKFLDYFLPLSTEGIRQSSLIREFVGGSCFHV